MSDCKRPQDMLVDTDEFDGDPDGARRGEVAAKNSLVGNASPSPTEEHDGKNHESGALV